MIAVVNVTMSFWRECRNDGNKLSTIRSFFILRSGKGLTFFNKDNSANLTFLVKNRYNTGFLFFENTRKSKISNSYVFSSTNLRCLKMIRIFRNNCGLGLGWRSDVERKTCSEDRDAFP